MLLRQEEKKTMEQKPLPTKPQTRKQTAGIQTQGGGSVQINKPLVTTTKSFVCTCAAIHSFNYSTYSSTHLSAPRPKVRHAFIHPLNSRYVRTHRHKQTPRARKHCTTSLLQQGKTWLLSRRLTTKFRTQKSQAKPSSSEWEGQSLRVKNQVLGGRLTAQPVSFIRAAGHRRSD